jgi:hypothetical protein
MERLEDQAQEITIGIRHNKRDLDLIESDLNRIHRKNLIEN